MRYAASQIRMPTPPANKKTTKRRSTRKAETQSTAWTQCAACRKELFGGVRCFDHSPTPEQREARERNRDPHAEQ